MNVLFRWLYFLKPRGTHMFCVLSAVIILIKTAVKIKNNVCSAIFILPNGADKNKIF